MTVRKSISWSTLMVVLRPCIVLTVFHSRAAVADDYASVVSFADRPYTVGWNGDEPPAPPFAILTRTEPSHFSSRLARMGLPDRRELLSAVARPFTGGATPVVSLRGPLSGADGASLEGVDSVLKDDSPDGDEFSVTNTRDLTRGDDWTGNCGLPEDVCAITCCESCCCVLWTTWADALWLNRSSPDSYDLVMDDEVGPTATNPARLNAEDLDFDYAPGFRLGLLHYLNECHSIGIGYFGVDGWNESATVIPPPSPLFVQYPGASVPIPGAVTFANGTDLYSAEINIRRHMTGWLSFLAGFRWVELNDQLLTFSSVLGPLYSIDTNNHLYGPQIGLDGVLWDEGGRLRVDGWLKAGVMYNRADQRTDEFVFGPATVADSADHTAFLGDLGVSALIRLTGSLGFRFGYQLLWLEGVALAPDQIAPTDITVPVAVLDTSGGLFFDGGFVGLELSW